MRLSPSNPRIKMGSGGRKLLITVSVHGNERCGTLAVNRLLTDFLHPDAEWTRHVSLDIILGNPEAYTENKRFIKRNINRMFSRKILESETGPELHGKELEHVQNIVSAIEECDALLDIHSCSADSPSFALPASNYRSESLAMFLPARYVILSLAHMTSEGGTSMDWILDKDKVGVCVECGQHTAPEVVPVAVEVIKAFILLHTVPTPRKHPRPDPGHSQILMRCVEMVVVREGFTFVKEVHQFIFVENGELICQDHAETVYCTHETGAFIAMPARMPVLGEEAFFWCVQVLPEEEEEIAIDVGISQAL